MEWIITCKISGKDGYNVFDAFRDLNEIDWSRSAVTTNVKKGDIIYIYVGEPYKKIMLKTICTKTLVDEKDLIIDDRKYYNNKSKWGYGGDGTYFRIKFIQKVNNDNLSLTSLRDKHFVKMNIQGSYKSENNELLFKYIQNIFNDKTSLIKPTDNVINYDDERVISFPTSGTYEYSISSKVHAHPLKKGISN